MVKWQFGLRPKYVGMKVLWWGRVGMGISLLGAGTIVLELIGSGPIRPFGSKLNNSLDFGDEPTWMLMGFKASRFFLKTFLSNVKRAFKWQPWRSNSANRKSPIDEDVEKFIRPFFVTPYLIFFAFTLVGVYRIVELTWHDINGVWNWVWFFSLPPILGIIGASVGLTGLLFVSELAILTITALLNGIAWGLNRPTIDKWIYFASALFILVGFHFDVLAS